MKILYTVEDRMEDELKEICKHPELSPSDVDMIYKMVDILKDTATYEAMKQSGYSLANSYENPGMSYAGGRGGNSNRGGMSYENSYGNSYGNSYDDYSFARGRDSMGRFTSREGGNSNRGGYSGHDKTSMIDGLREEMHKASSEAERENYRRVIEQLER